MSGLAKDLMLWLLASGALIGACMVLPLWIKNDALRNFVMRWVLVPVSIVIIVYVYPAGIHLFSRMALQR